MNGTNRRAMGTIDYVHETNGSKIETKSMNRDRVSSLGAGNAPAADGHRHPLRLGPFGPVEMHATGTDIDNEKRHCHLTGRETIQQLRPNRCR